MPDTTGKLIVLYDGVCGLCNRLVQFLSKRDHLDRFRFAALQSDFARTLLRRHNFDAGDLDTVYVVVDSGQTTERVLARSDAILSLFEELGGPWRLAALGKVFPQSVRNSVYKLVARYRYRIFGRSDSCVLPQPQQKRKFLE